MRGKLMDIYALMLATVVKAAFGAAVRAVISPCCQGTVLMCS
jgi:hypothetical protein